MTNNPTIDGVSRELLSDLVKLASRNVKSAWSGGICGRAQALLDAPAVERQDICGKHSGDSCKTCGGSGMVNDGELTHSAGGILYENGPIKNASEVAYNLQAENAALQSTIAQLQARVQELESGRGEPVAWAVFTEKGNIRIWSSDCKAVGLRVEEEEGRPSVPLFTAPPASVAVVLPEPVGQVVEFGKGLKEVSWVKGGMPDLGSILYTSAPVLVLPSRRSADDFQSKSAPYDSADALADTWNACLDATAALNGERK